MLNLSNGHPGRFAVENGKTESSSALEASPTMQNMLAALKDGEDIGDFGRLTFVTAARHFMPDNQIAHLLSRQPAIGEQEARVLIKLVKEHDYSPPTREQILEWQNYQEFQICNPNDPGSCDLYSELELPRYILERVEHVMHQELHA